MAHAAAARAPERPRPTAEEARRGVSQARMHLRGVLKVFEAQEWAEEMPQVLEELEKCAAEVEKAEQEVV